MSTTALLESGEKLSPPVISFIEFSLFNPLLYTQMPQDRVRILQQEYLQENINKYELFIKWITKTSTCERLYVEIF